MSGKYGFAHHPTTPEERALIKAKKCPWKNGRGKLCGKPAVDGDYCARHIRDVVDALVERGMERMRESKPVRIMIVRSEG